MSGYGDFAEDEQYFGYDTPRESYRPPAGGIGGSGSAPYGASAGPSGGYLKQESLDQPWSQTEGYGDTRPQVPGQVRPQGQGQPGPQGQGQPGPGGRGQPRPLGEVQVRAPGPGGAAHQQAPPVDKAMELIRSNEPQFKEIQDMREEFIRKHPVGFFPASPEFLDDIQSYRDKLEINLFPLKPEHFAKLELQVELTKCKKYVVHSNKIGDTCRGHAVIHYRTADQAAKAYQALNETMGAEVRVSRKLTPEQFEAIRRSQQSKDSLDTMEDSMLLAASVLYVSNLPSDTVALDLSMLFPTAKDIMIYPATIVGNYGYAYVVFPDLREAQDAFCANIDRDEPLKINGQPIAISMNQAPENTAYADVLDRNTRKMMFETLRQGRELALSKHGQDNPIYVTRMLEKLCRMMCRDYIRVERDEEARDHLALPRNLPHLNKLIPDIYLERWRLYDDMGKQIAPPRNPRRPKPYDRPEPPGRDYDDYAPPYRQLPPVSYPDYY